jgi:hypothetical protein
MSTKRRRAWMGMAILGLVTSVGCQTWYGGMTLPSGRYLQHYPQYFAPDPQHPLPRELSTSIASIEEPAGARPAGAAMPAGVPPAAPAPAPAPKQ